MFHRFIPAVLVALVLAPLSHAQLSARQLFYDDAAPKKPATKPVAPVKPKAQPKAAQPKPAPAGDTVRMQGPPATPDAVQTVQAKPLAMRYSILKMLPSNETLEVDVASAFRTGDKIQLLVEGNQAGYLYIFSQGTSGTWKALFPSDAVEGGDNRIRPGKPVLLPSEEHTITFAGKPGVEKLFVLFSRNPNEDMDKLIYQQTNNTRTLLASAPIAPAVVDRLKVQTRDLVIEQVKEKGAASAKPQAAALNRMSESAVYVATKDASPGAKVISEIQLKHE